MESSLGTTRERVSMARHRARARGAARYLVLQVRWGGGGVKGCEGV